MKMFYKVTLAAALGLTVAAVALPIGAMAQMKGHTASAGFGQMGGQMMRGAGGGFDFAALDADGDGRVTEAEIAAHRAAEIAGLDADADGFLTAEELSAHQMRMAQQMADKRSAQMLERLDADGDGRIGVAEMMMGAHGDQSQMFARLDANGDGAITQEEIAALRANAGQMRGNRRGDMQAERGNRQGRMNGQHDGQHGRDHGQCDGQRNGPRVNQ